MINEKLKKIQYCSKREMMKELHLYRKTGVISEKLGQIFLDIATKYANNC